MSIWNYNDLPWPIDENLCTSPICVFCKINLNSNTFYPEGKLGKKSLIIKSCIQCGWWNGEYIFTDCESRNVKTEYYKNAYGILKNLNLKSIQSPLEEIQQYLTVRYEQIYSLHPQLMEEVVGSVFRNLGYNTLVTNFSGDKGIDAILYDDSSDLIGVQVRRYKNKIDAEQIRGFTGALVQGGYTRGIFVTTSDFQKGAKESAGASAAIGVPIILLNYKSFFDALKISQSAQPVKSKQFEDYNVDKFRLTSYIPVYDEN